MQMRIACGRLARPNETCLPVLANGLATISVRPVRECEVAVEIAGDPQGPWTEPDAASEARAVRPRTWGLRLQAPTWVRLRVLDMRSWAKPVDFEIATLSEVPENLSIDDRRPPPARPYQTVDPALPISPTAAPDAALI
jgi:hypothetical protein